MIPAPAFFVGLALLTYAYRPVRFGVDRTVVSLANFKADSDRAAVSQAVVGPLPHGGEL